MNVVHAVREQRFQLMPPRFGQQQGIGIDALGEHPLHIAETLLLVLGPLRALRRRGQRSPPVSDLGRVVHALCVDADQQRVDLTARKGNLVYNGL